MQGSRGLRHEDSEAIVNQAVAVAMVEQSLTL
jgi:hypothetical protein